MTKINIYLFDVSFVLYFVFTLITLSLIKSIDSQTITQLNYYEIIDRIDIKFNKIVKRSAERSSDNVINDSVGHLVSFRAIDRDFNLLLTQNKDIISSQFNAFTIDSKGRKKAIFVDFNEFYSGRVVGIDGSDVRAHISPNGLMTASIQTKGETYEIEPLWRHLDNHKNNTNSMIIYKHSDFTHSSDSSNTTNPSKHFCDFIKIEDNVTNDDIDAEERIRRKRQTLFDLNEITISDEINKEFKPQATHCAVVLVADYLFFQTMGNSDQKTTINYLIHIIDRVNNIFNNTDWTEDESRPGFKGMGFFIKEIQIHSEPSEDPDHFNSLSYSTKPVRDVLESFSRNRENRQFCLAHLFTHQTFDGSVLGLAYVASPRPGSVGGICSPSYAKSDTTLYLNTGLTTTRNAFGNRIITREAVLVTTHEFGHNWGSEHDPHTDECSPTSQKGGAYLMYTYSVSGYDDNNKFFSPCSRRSIRAVLIHKSQKCFSKPDKAYCGNSKVEEDEECDEGLIVKGDEVRQGLCCDSRCRLTAGAYCSDKNSECCAGCRIRIAGTVCKHKDVLNCKEESVCDGESDKCPKPSALADGSKCLDRGECRGGKCINFCASRGHMTCMCEEERNACFRCCRSNTTYGRCSPIEPRDPLQDGTSCRYGFCERQRCERAVQDFVERFWDVIEEININTFLIFMKDNIIGFVVIISLIVWIPICCVIDYYDNHHKKWLKRYSVSTQGAERGAPPGAHRRTFNRDPYNIRRSRPTVRQVRV